jgi:hypothetical protein
MPPKNGPVKELLAEGLPHTSGGQDLTTTEATILTTHIPQTSHPHTSTEYHVATADGRRPEGLEGQPSTQAEVLATNTATAIPHQDPHREAEAQEDHHQDSKEEIKAIIETN